MSIKLADPRRVLRGAHLLQLSTGETAQGQLLFHSGDPRRVQWAASFHRSVIRGGQSTNQQLITAQYNKDIILFFKRCGYNNNNNNNNTCI